VRRVDLDRAALTVALRESNGFLARAARRLGVSRMAVMRRAREAGLDGEARQLRHATGWRIGRPR